MGTLQFILASFWLAKGSLATVCPEKELVRRALDHARFVNTPARLVSAYKSQNVLNRVITPAKIVRKL